MEPMVSWNENILKPMLGHTICAVLKDGSFYMGSVRVVEDGYLVLDGFKGNGSVSANPRTGTAQISGMLGSLFGGGGMPNLGSMMGGGMMPNLGSMMGGGFPGMGMGGMGGTPGMVGGTGMGSGGAAGGRGGGMFGSFGRGLKIGWNVLSFIMPMMGFKI
ncbi:hypothetical protein [Ferviditalea candida]|uniref:Uncharacterized protein n=1 Tax=Ferviditalea candida TaxID=3108399 RepID=A0ABU5ZH11_9BACL|nr:hypothetical protein [Paenibacillaceae bacterium T2]